MELNYWMNRINEASARRNYSALPKDFERDAVRMFYTREIKNMIPNWVVGPRIKASKAETFQELRSAIIAVCEAYQAKMERLSA